MRYKWSLSPALSSILILGFTFSAEGSNQPYIDRLKEVMKEEGTDTQISPESSISDPYIQELKKKMKAQPASNLIGQDYIDLLKRTDPSLNEKPSTEKSFIEEKKAEIAPKKLGGAIQNVIEGKSELEPKRGGPIHHAFGLRYGFGLNRPISASSGTQLRDFNDVYGANYAPDLSVFYEYQPFHSEWLGNIGIVGLAGISYFSGPGKFAINIKRPDGTDFPLTSSTNFQFFAAPVTVALDYRFNLFRYVRPFIMAGPSMIGYAEKRSDNISGNTGITYGVLVSVGASFLLDWIGRGNSWELYSEFGIKHYYLTIDYTEQRHLAGDLNYNVNGIRGGFTFEY